MSQLASHPVRISKLTFDPIETSQLRFRSKNNTNTSTDWPPYGLHRLTPKATGQATGSC